MFGQQKLDLEMNLDLLEMDDIVKIHPVFKMPMKPTFGDLPGKTMQIPYNSDYYELIYNCFQANESVNAHYDTETYTWFIEYGTKPIEVDAPWNARKSINIGRMAALMAANKAIQTNDWILQDAGYYTEEPPQLQRKWSKCELRLYIDSSCNDSSCNDSNCINDCILLNFIRIDGDRSSASDIWKSIKAVFN